MKGRHPTRKTLGFERLEDRLLLSGASAVDRAEFHPVIVAGDPNGTPTDSPTIRVDANTATSAFAGVGSLRVNTTRGTYICTATPFDSTHVLSAGHCLDINGDGRITSRDGIRSVVFQLNLDNDTPTDQVDVSINASSYRVHPDYTGFARPSVNDDLSVITLSTALPASVPTYSLYTSPLVAGSTRLVMVGYGRSGTGVSGYTTGASYTVKRRGENMVDAFYTQDDSGRPAANEVFRFDFDGPTGSGTFGGPTLGNNVETTLGGGDSGGPSFVLCAGCDPALASSYRIAGVDTFTQGSAPFFGSLGGGIAVPSYANWILTGSTATSGGGGGSGSGASSTIGFFDDDDDDHGGDHDCRTGVDSPAAGSISVLIDDSSDEQANSDGRSSNVGVQLDDQQQTPKADDATASVIVYVLPELSLAETDRDAAHDRLLRALDDLLESGASLV